jgi:hypothetical protein
MIATWRKHIMRRHWRDAHQNIISRPLRPHLSRPTFKKAKYLGEWSKQPPIYQTHFWASTFYIPRASSLLTLPFNYTWRVMLHHCGVIHHRYLILRLPHEIALSHRLQGPIWPCWHRTSFNLKMFNTQNYWGSGFCPSFGILNTIKTKSYVFWDVTPCDSCKNWRIGGT